MMVPVIANPHVPGWPAHEKPDGSMTVPGAAQYLPPAQAFAVDFDTDAHFQACSVPELPHRLTYDALPHLERGAAIVLFVVDVDAPEHGGDGQDAVESWWANERPRLTKLLETHAGGFVYRTRGGYRIVYRFDPPHVMRSADDGTAWRMFYTRSLLYLWREFRITGDPACKDWTRLYRLPHATRDLQAGPERRDVIGDPTAIGVWRYVPAGVDVDLATARELGGDGKGPWQVTRKALEALKAPPRAQAEPAAPQYDGGETRRARKALETQCEAIATAPNGSRHATIYGAAADLGHLICGREIEEPIVVAALFDAADRSGEVKDYGKADVERCIRDGLAFGKQTPPRQPLRPRRPKNGHGGGNDWTCCARQAAENGAAPGDPDRFADAQYDGRPPPGEEQTPEPKQAERGLHPVSTLTQSVVDLIERRADGRERPVSVPWYDYERATDGGLRAGLEGIVGGTGTLKTQLITAKLLHAAGKGVPCYFVTLELTKEQSALRMLCDLADVSWSRCETGRATAQDLVRIRAAKPRLDALPILIDEGAAMVWSTADMDFGLATVRRQWPTGPLYGAVDFTQLVGSVTPTRDIRDRVGQIAYQMREVSKRYGAAVTAISSTARANYVPLADIGALAKLDVVDGELIVGNHVALQAAAKEAGEIEFAVEQLSVVARWPAPLENGETLLIVAQGKYRYHQRCRWFALAVSHGRLVEYRVRSMTDLPEVKRPKGGRGTVDTDEYERRILDYVARCPGTVRTKTGFRRVVEGTKAAVDAAAGRLVARGAIVRGESGGFARADGQEGKQ
ncbi:MAG: hypothetical protein JW940_12660 [Polyangiaceae bacterium]|nr:hypothetical protein [Polyangiaceae bacterium]